MNKAKTHQENMITRETYLEKPLPSSPESEKAVVGGIILDNNLMSEVIELGLKPEHFYSPNLRLMFEAMVRLSERGERIDPILISEELKRLGEAVESIGGIYAITQTTAGLPHFTTLDNYARIVIQKATARDFIKACSLAISETLSEESDVLETIDAHEQQTFELRRMTQSSGGFLDSYHLAQNVIKAVRDRALQASSNALTGISTGFRDLNSKTSGYGKNDLIIVAARPSMGKTSMAIDTALNTTDDDPGAVVAIFSLESSKEEIVARQITQRAKVDSLMFKQSMLGKDAWMKVANALADLEQKKILIDDSPNLTVLEMQARARRLKVKHKRLDLIIIDHLGHVKGSGREESRALEVGKITKALKAMAKLLDCPVMVLSQLSRKCEARNPPRPIMSDLRDSGNIEEDADTVLLLYREAYYPNLRTPQNERIAELIIGKNRNGPTGVVKLYWTDYCTHFEDLSI